MLNCPESWPGLFKGQAVIALKAIFRFEDPQSILDLFWPQP